MLKSINLDCIKAFDDTTNILFVQAIEGAKMGDIVYTTNRNLVRSILNENC